MRPAVGAVIGDIEGQIADDGDALFFGVAVDALPLPAALVLRPAVEGDLIRQCLPPVCHRFGLAVSDGSGPCTPGDGRAEVVAQRHEEGIIFEPGGVLLFKAADPGIPLVPLKSEGQQMCSAAANGCVVDAGGICAPGHGVQLVLVQESFGCQPGKIDIERIESETGKRLVRRVCQPGGTDRQDLPKALAGLRQTVDEAVGFCGEAARPMGGRQ